MGKSNLYDDDDEPLVPRKVNATVPDLTQFVLETMPGKLEMNWHHQLYYDILENRIIQKEDGKLYLNTYVDANGVYVPDGTVGAIPSKINKNILMMAPRFHSKSQCFTINYPIWRIYKNPNIRILIVSANDDIAQSFNRAIINNLENNQKLIDGYGYLVPEYPKKWGEKALLIKRDSMEKDPTVAAIGVGGKLISRRADIIIIDDPIDIETARTKQSRYKTREWFENVLLPILEDDGQLIIAGTAWYRGDIYDTLWQESQFDIKLKLKALIYNQKFADPKNYQMRYIPYSLREYPMALKVQDIMSDEVIDHYQLYKNLKSGVLWEAKWSYQKLISKKLQQNMSNGSFMRQYLNEPTTEEEKVFKEGDMKRLTDRGFGKELWPSWDNSSPVQITGYGHMVIAIGVDLAISKKTTSDNSCIAVWGLTDDRRRVLLWLDYGKWSPEETKQKVIEAFYNFKPVKIRVENVAYQDMLRQELAVEDINVEGFHTTSSKKFNPETGLAHIAMLLEQDKLIIPTSTKNETYFERIKQILYEMHIYSYDQHAGDTLMASWFALDVLKDFDKKLRDNRGFFNTEALVAQMKSVRAAHRVVLLSPNFYRTSMQSLVYVFRAVDGKEMFIKPDEPFFIFATREERSVAYVIQKETNEIVARIEGDLTAVMFSSLLERAGEFFNKAQIIMDRNGEGQAIYMELEKRLYRNLMCFQPDEHGNPYYTEGFKISSASLPIAVDYFRMNVDQLKYEIPDEQLVKEMGDTISVDGDKMIMSFGVGQRIKTISIALWLLDNYENMEKQMANQPKKRKPKPFRPPYKIFQ